MFSPIRVCCLLQVRGAEMVARLAWFFGGLAYDGLVRQDSPQRVRYRAAQLR